MPSCPPASTDNGTQLGQIVKSSVQYNVRAAGHVAKLRRDLSV